MFNFSDVRETSIMVPNKAKLKRPVLFKGMKRIAEDKSVVFDFWEEGGNTLSHREFVPTRQDGATDDEYKKSIAGTVSRIAHICRAFVTQAEFDAVRVDDPNNLAKAGENWLNITKQVGILLKGKVEATALLPNGTHTGLPCEIKVIYVKNKQKYYAALPKVPSFISTDNHPKDFSVNPTYDIFEIPTMTPTDMPGQGGAPAGGAPTGGAMPGMAGGGAAASGSDDF